MLCDLAEGKVGTKERLMFEVLFLATSDGGAHSIWEVWTADGGAH